MKKTILSVLALAAMLSVSARQLQVVSIEQVPNKVVSEMATISPDGSYAVAGVMGSQTLYRVDLASGHAVKLTDNGSPMGVEITPDGQNVVFRASTFKNNLRYTSLEQVSVANGRQTQLVKPSRHLNAGVSVANGSVTAVENGRRMAKALPGGRSQAQPVASINYGHLDVTDAQGVTRTIDPQGRGSYLWPSISPDGTKVAYVLVGAGAFVCNIDGTGARQLGHMQAPKWLGNDMIIAMANEGNSQQITGSRIVASDLKGNIQTLTPADMIALYPSASADGSVVIFSDAEGSIYKMNIK